MRSTDAPNILIIVLDSALPEMLSCYADGPDRSPSIDRIAADGMIFDQAIAASSWTLPSMASVFTAMCPSKHGAHDQHWMLDSPYPTMAEIFCRNGYHTAAFSDVPYVGPMTNLHRGFETMSNMRANQVRLPSKIRKALARVRRNLSRQYQKTHETPLLFSEGLAWLKDGWDRSRPFFLYIHSDETHGPLLPPAKYRRMYTDLTERQMRAINQDPLLLMTGTVPMTEEDFENLRRLSCAELTFVDEWVGRLLDYLQRAGLRDDTIVVLMADHGDNFGEHGLLRHGLCLYDTLLRVPLLLAYPAGLEPERVGGLVQLIDLCPTLMGLAGISEPEAEREFQGRDAVTAALTGEFAEFTVSELYPVVKTGINRFPEYEQEFQRKYDRILRAVRTETTKFIWSSNGVHELYDLTTDPGELDNLIDRRPELAAEMQARLDGWLSSFGATIEVGVGATPHEPSADDPQVLERLRDLGYID